MKIFIDTANTDEIREAESWGVIAGVTTNPSLIASEGKKLEEVIKEIAAIINGPVSAEVISLEYEGMIAEARKLSSIHPNVVVKIPMCIEGLKAVKTLSLEKIKTNVTLVFSPAQAILAARAGAVYVSPFVGRIDDTGTEGMELIRQITAIYANYNISTQIIAASIRNPMHAINAALAGADISTIPYKVLIQMTKHPLTDLGIEKFLKDWESKNCK